MAGKYRVAVVGDSDCGGYGHGIDNCWLEIPATQIVAVADPVESGRADRVQTLGADQGFADYREMLDTVKPDIVGIGPRWVDQRHEMIMAVAERGIHMYVEKPFCRNLQEADDIVAACEKHDVKLGIAHQTRYSPKIQVIRDLIEDGEIGHVLELRGRGERARYHRRRRHHGNVGALAPHSGLADRDGIGRLRHRPAGTEAPAVGRFGRNPQCGR